MISNDDQRITKDVEGNFVVKSAATWTTDEEVPDPVIPRVLGEWVVVRPLTLGGEIVTKSGFTLIVADKEKDKREMALTIGKVIGVGEQAGKRAGTSKVNVGDFVLFPRYNGQRVSYDGVKVVFLFDDQLLAVVDKTKALEFN